MRNVDPSGFEAFAADFFRAYWETVKAGEFSMPPNEPVEVALEEMLATVSYTAEMDSLSTILHMSAEFGDWWDFRFQKETKGWRLVGATARSDDDSKPHDLLGTVFAPYFEPFLRRVTGLANQRAGT
jgi:hypothetical protein